MSISLIQEKPTHVATDRHYVDVAQLFRLTIGLPLVVVKAAWMDVELGPLCGTTLVHAHDSRNHCGTMGREDSGVSASSHYVLRVDGRLPLDLPDTTVVTSLSCCNIYDDVLF